MRLRTGVITAAGVIPFPAPGVTGTAWRAGEDQVDLAPVLARMCGRMVPQVSGADRLFIKPVFHSTPVSGRTASHLARVFTELFGNALVHAYAPGVAGPVHTCLCRSGAETRLTVSDSGTGLAAEVEGGGITRARTAMVRIGGTLTLEPRPGTAWCAVVPDGAVPPRPARTLH